MADRIQQLIAFYNDDPQDPFNIYALALEYLKSDLTKAKALFDELLQNHQNYIPTYYHAAKLYQELNEREKAIAVYEKGLEVMKRMQDNKAWRELNSAYQEFIFED
ncbi:tetratricopeptide repeat protein [Chryseosolibacter indicus]|uniref:Tetratricopeptide repeat-containing protein n=1 Tax=Chryseosolibacter indicus TaxID=2782351 RepID=A0ABS5VPS2_9BACT|nr:tetratricopeptide repeat protein [Chryseosolibacter indicus]MBT1703442.1 tetratricopeptide repeat-containing protein [Chryseosolibacter indicus]